MGCFFACFGFKTPKKKRQKSRNISSSVEQNHGSYSALDSDVFIKLDTTEKHNTLDSEIKEKPKEASISKINNKVSFNLNVEAYEPIHKEENISTFLSDSDEEELTKWEFNAETTSHMATLHFTQYSVSSRINKSYPQNHRYRNCSTDEIYDEEEDDGYEFEDDLSSNEDKRDNCDSENYEKNSILKQNLCSKNEELEGIGSDLYANDRKKHVLSVLSPVENLSQWKAVKAKVASLRHEKENAVLDHEYEPNTPKCHPKEEQSLDPCALKNMKSWKVLGDQERSVTVDASLSNWLLRLT